MLGLQLAPINRQTRVRYDLAEDATGALVVGIQSGSLAADLGFKPGDIIVKVGDKTVLSPLDVTEGVRQAGDADRKAVLLLVQRQGNGHFVGVPLPKS